MLVSRLTSQVFVTLSTREYLGVPVSRGARVVQKSITSIAALAITILMQNVATSVTTAG